MDDNENIELTEDTVETEPKTSSSEKEHTTIKVTGMGVEWIDKSLSKHKNKKGKKVKKQKVIKSEPVLKLMKSARLKAITHMTIETGWLTEVRFSDSDAIKLTDSWKELILILLGYLYETNPIGMMGTLVKCKALSEGFNLTSSRVIYPESSGIKNEVYKLKHSKYFVEFRDNSASYVKAIKGLIDALKIDSDAVRFTIVPIDVKSLVLSNNYDYSVLKKNTSRTNKSSTSNGAKGSSDVSGIGPISFTDIEQVNVKETLKKYVSKHKEVDIKSLIIYGNKRNVTGIKQALVVFMLWTYGLFGERLIEAALKYATSGIGLTDAHHIDDIDTVEIIPVGEEHYLYCITDITEAAKYIWNIADYLGFKVSEIEVEYQELKLK